MDPGQKRGGVAQAGLFRRRGSAAAEQAGGGAIPEAGRVGGGASGGAGASRCRRAGWQAAGPQWPGVWAARPAEGHGLLSGPRRHRWRRRSARLGVVRLRLGLRTRDQNALGGADAAPAGFSGKVAPSPAPCLPRSAMAMAARAAGPGPEAAAAPHSALVLRLRGRTACLGLGIGGGGGGGVGTLRNSAARPSGLSCKGGCGAGSPVGDLSAPPAGALPGLPHRTRLGTAVPAAPASRGPHRRWAAKLSSPRAERIPAGLSLALLVAAL